MPPQSALAIRNPAAPPGPGPRPRRDRRAPRLSIAIVNFESGYRLRQCLDAIARHPPSCPHEVLVVDNGSRDGSTAFLQRHPRPGVRLVASPVNLLFTAAVNLAFAESRGELFLILNPDMVALPGSLGALVRHMDEDGTLGGIGGYTLGPDGAFERYVNRFPTPLAVFLTYHLPARWTRRLALCRRYAMLDEDFSVPREAPQPAGGCLLFRRSLFPGTPMGPGFGLYWSDVELARRIWMAGRRIMVFPDARFLHDDKAHGAAKATTPRSLLLNLDYFVGCRAYFRRYEGFLPALAAKSLFAAAQLASLLLHLGRALRGAEPWSLWRARARAFASQLRDRNEALLQARREAIGSGFQERHPVF